MTSNRRMSEAAQAGVPSQLVLDLSHRSALGAEDFFVSQSNHAAVDLIDRWPHWQHWAAFVAGPAGAGKSHLAHVWQLKSGAALEAAPTLGESAIGRLKADGAIVVEDVDRGIGSEQVLFHLLNMAREHKLSVLITSRKAPGALSVLLPDLKSRLRALPFVSIAEPGEALLRAVLVKLFADRQLHVDPLVISHLCRHMERSMEAANRVVAELDRLALARQKRVTRALASEALGNLPETDSEPEPDLAP